MIYDVLVVGAGPAGLTAALYALRANKTVLVLEKSTPGGQMTFSPKVENFLGFLQVSGNELADKLVEQVLEQGADMDFGCVKSLSRHDGIVTADTGSHTFDARTVILATGVKHRLLGLPRETEFVGNGISFCAVCDGAFYRDKTVAVIGGGNSALQEALLLSENCKKVVMVQNLPAFTGEEKLRQAVAARSNIETIFGTTVTAFLGEDTLAGLALKNEAGNTSELPLDGVFIAIGLIPENEPFAAVAPLNDYGYFDSDERCLTPTDNIFVAGDCRQKSVRQITTAAADGAVAALAACRYLDNL